MLSQQASSVPSPVSPRELAPLAAAKRPRGLQLSNMIAHGFVIDFPSLLHTLI